MGIFDFLPFRKRTENPKGKRVPQLMHVRRYKAAKSDRITPFTMGVNTPAREQNRQDLLGLVSHSRQMAQNNPFMRHFLRTIQRNVIGPNGLRFVSLAARPDGSEDKPDRQAMQMAFDEWSKRGNCTVCGQMSFKTVQKRAAKWAARDGVCFVRQYVGREFGPHNYQVQLLPVEMLDHEYNEDRGGANYVHGGIEYNRFDRPIAYHFFKAGSFRRGQQVMRQERVRVPAGEVHVITIGDDDVAGLGVPWAHATIRDMNLEEGFEESAMTAAQAGAAKMGFFTVNGEVSASILENQTGLPGATDQDGMEYAGGLVEPEIEEVEPGMLSTLPAGYDFKEFNPGYPDAAIDPFLKVVLRRMSAGVGLSYATFTGDLSNANFSSLRRGVQEERDEYNMLQDWFQEVFCEPIFAAWLPVFLISNRNAQAYRLPFGKIEKFQRHEWQGRGFESVNPLDDAKTNNMNISAGLDSPQRVARRAGRDFETVVTEISEAMKFAESLGVPLSFQPSTMVKAEPVAPGQGDNNDETE